MSLTIFKFEKAILTSLHCLGQSAQAIEFVKTATDQGCHVYIAHEGNDASSLKEIKQNISEQKIPNVEIVSKGFGENCWEAMLAAGYDPVNILCLSEAEEKETYLSQYGTFTFMRGNANIALVEGGDTKTMTEKVKGFAPQILN